jgi:hypothetical protein
MVLDNLYIDNIRLNQPFEYLSIKIQMILSNEIDNLLYNINIPINNC